MTINLGLTTRDVARELARRYSTMTHEELDVLEHVLVPMKYQKGERTNGLWQAHKKEKIF